MRSDTKSVKAGYAAGRPSFISRPTAPGRRSSEREGRHGLDEFSTARVVTHRALAALEDELSPVDFIETLLREALCAAGASNGAIALLDEGPNDGAIRYAAIIKHGRPLSQSEIAAQGIADVAASDGIREFAARVCSSPHGVRSSPDDVFYTPAMRRYLKGIGIRSMISMRLAVGNRMIGWLGAGYDDIISPDSSCVALLRPLADQMTMAVELTRLAEIAGGTASAQERAQTAQSRIDQLLAANRALSNALGSDAASVIDNVLAFTLQSLGDELLGSEGGGALWLADVDRRVQHRHLVYQDGRVLAAGDADFPGGNEERSMRAEMFKPRYLSGDPFRMRLSDLEPYQRAYHRGKGCRSLIVFPMVLAGRPAGGFYLCLARHHRDPSIADLRFSQAMTQQATLAVELTRLSDAARQEAIARLNKEAAEAHVAELTRANGAFRDTLAVLSDELDLGGMLGKLLRVAAGQIECATAAMCLRDDDGVFTIAVTLIADVVAEAGPHLALDERQPARRSPLWPHLVRTRTPLVLSFPAAGRRLFGLETWFVESGARCLLIVPLLHHGEVNGCFMFRFETLQHFAAGRLQLLQTLADQTMLAVQLERLARIAQSKSERAATLAERTRIARDLHDTLAQGLTGILMHLQAAERVVGAEQVREHVRAALSAARDALVDATRSVYSLRASPAERSEFMAALKAVLRTTFAGSAVATEVDGVRAPGLSESTENELLRVAQEAAANTLKHARASRFVARTARDADVVELSLEDDGVGFEVAPARTGFGLLGIAERMRRLGGTFRIASRPGDGTRLVVRVPADRAG